MPGHIYTLRTKINNNTIELVKKKLMEKLISPSFATLDEFHDGPDEALLLFTQDLKRLLQLAIYFKSFDCGIASKKYTGSVSARNHHMIGIIVIDLLVFMSPVEAIWDVYMYVHRRRKMSYTGGANIFSVTGIATKV